MQFSSPNFRPWICTSMSTLFVTKSSNNSSSFTVNFHRSFLRNLLRRMPKMSCQNGILMALSMKIKFFFAAMLDVAQRHSESSDLRPILCNWSSLRSASLWFLRLFSWGVHVHYSTIRDNKLNQFTISVDK